MMAEYKVGSREKCPHCQTVVKFIPPGRGSTSAWVVGNSQYLSMETPQCPECGKIVVTIGERIELDDGEEIEVSTQVVWPLSSGKPPAPKEVPTDIANDYNESAIVLNFSAKASAALSRRCLQAVLSDAGKTTEKNLSKQIDEVLGSLPSYIAENLDAIRNIGNFAAHEQKSKNSGSILDVETGEAEWNLEVLDSLFDFYYVRPEIESKKRTELDKKLVDAGKPPMKKP